MDEAQTIAPPEGFTASTASPWSSPPQAPKELHNQIPGNAVTQSYGLLSAPAQISSAREMARAKGGLMPDISRLRAGNFYVAIEGSRFAAS